MNNYLMKIFKNKRFYASILLDFSFLFALYMFLSLVIKEIKSYAYVLQDFGNKLSSLEPTIQANITNLDYTQLLSNVEIINQIAQKIIFLFSVMLIGSFILYLSFQSVQWSFILSKLKNLKKYFLKFGIVSLFSFLLFITFLWYMLLNARNIILSYLSSMPTTNLFIKLILLYALIFLLGYYTNVCYVFLNKHKFLEALKKTILLNNIKSMLVYLACFVSILLILVLWPMFNLSSIYLIILEIILILTIINWFRYYLIRIL